MRWAGNVADEAVFSISRIGRHTLIPVRPTVRLADAVPSDASHARTYDLFYQGLAAENTAKAAAQRPCGKPVLADYVISL